MSDTVTLSLPRNPQYYSVARWVLGGLAQGRSISVEELDELRMAVGTLLDRDDLPSHGDVQLKLDVDDSSFCATLGPFDHGSLDNALRRSSDAAELNLRRVLDTIVDTVEVEPSGENGSAWVRLTKKVAALA